MTDASHYPGLGPKQLPSLPHDACFLNDKYYVTNLVTDLVNNASVLYRLSL